MRFTFKGLKSKPRLFLYGLIGLFLGPTCVYTANNTLNSKFPSIERKEFVEQFNIPLEGYKSDIEREDRIVLIAQVLNREKFTRDFDLEKIVVRSNNFFKRSLSGQIAYFDTSNTEIASTVTRRFIGNRKDILQLEESKPELLILGAHHEIKHTKTYDIVEENSSFKKKWMDAASEDGNSFYTEDISVLKKIEITQEELEQQGFITLYSKLDRLEDIAELCANAELHPERFYKLLYEKPNQKFIDKIALAEEKKLIPPEFSRYVFIREVYNQSFPKKEFDPSMARRFLEESKQLLGSIYECDLRERRGMIKLYFAKTNTEFTIEDAVEEHKKGLLAQYKDPHAYAWNLISLEGCHIFLGDYKTADIYKEAKKEYQNTRSVNTVINGVNEFLKGKGIRLD